MNKEEAGHILWSAPKTQEEAYIKWRIATKVLQILIAIGFVSPQKVEEAINIVNDLKE